jgi:hypothetical protein
MSGSKVTAVLVAAGFALASTAVAGDKDKAPTAGDQARTVSAGELAKNVSQYHGQRVAVTAEVDDVLSAHGFTLDADKLFVGPDVLVIIPAPDAAQSLKEDEKVTVSGTARRFVRSELDREFDWFGATAEKWEVEYKTRPVIVADSVRTADGRELVGPAKADKKN